MQVTDTSGGCGTMYNVEITADEFKYAPCVVAILKHRKQAVLDKT